MSQEYLICRSRIWVSGWQRARFRIFLNGSSGQNESGIPYLQVQDLGIGMAESEIPHIFERFFRSDEVRSSTGTGLGLSIAKWIVDKHGGHFEILSRQGLGTRIRILLPQSTVS